jgi:hypothetical protein
MNSPTQILIIRHGEKIGDPKKDDVGGPDLSIQGSARATALPSLFLPITPLLSCELNRKTNTFHGGYQSVPIQGKAPRFQQPDFIFATQKSKHSNRPVETVTPLSIAIGLTINDGFADKDSDITTMADAILQDSAYAGKVVLICWHHGKIPALAQALGVSSPPKWDGKIFDRVWQITFPKGKAKLDDLPQMLLYGDSPK